VKQKRKNHPPKMGRNRFSRKERRKIFLGIKSKRKQKTKHYKLKHSNSKTIKKY